MASDDTRSHRDAASTAPWRVVGTRSLATRRLVVIYGRELGRHYVLDGLQTIGRASENTICFNEDAVSRRHAEVMVDGARVQLRDLNSTNKTYVNDRKLDDPNAPIDLKDGDTIKIGHTIMKYFDGSNVESSYFEKIYEKSTLDKPTGTYNRHSFEERLADAHTYARTDIRRPTFALIEIHRSRRGNELWSPRANDHVLRETAKLIHRSIRAGDVLARYDSSQFAVLLHEMNYPEAIQLAEGLRSRVAEHDFVFEGKLMGLTVSIGLATWRREFSDCSQWSEAAETCLMQAKTAGRNRVVSNFTRPPEPDELCVLLSGSRFDPKLIQAFLDTLCESFELDTNSELTVDGYDAERRLRSNPGLLAAWFRKVCGTWNEEGQRRAVEASLRGLAERQRELLDRGHHVFMTPGSHHVIVSRKSGSVSSTRCLEDTPAPVELG